MTPASAPAGAAPLRDLPVLASLAIVVPIFGVIGLGYLARRLDVLTDRAGEGLSEYVFVLAVPCLIFRTLARADLPAAQPWGYWFSYFAAAGLVWVIATLVARRVFRVSQTAGVVAGFAAAQSNTVFVGVPIILEAYKDEGAVPLFLLLAIHLPIMMTLATLLAEGRSASLATLLRRILLHPIILGITAGALFRIAGPTLPASVWQVLDLIADSAIPCALISLGIALRRYGLESGLALPSVIAGLKLVVHPLLVLLLTKLFAMPPAWAGVAVLFAACPSGVNAYLFAERYGEGVGLASSSVALTSLLGIGTTVLWLQVLGVGG